ncbi:type VI secretion system tip protein VgrG [uncultured Shewanella sp.]|uniref:type VI secretion system tip protein VgrG n=1 Tax=uncultured Shewanella sp. TaxID=173975 RepID=UPI0026192334|nr:type VI secretion system tip protein VgrG [uncultured Shewanella sp.]
MSEFIISSADNSEVKVSVEKFKFISSVNRIPCVYLVLNEDSKLFDDKKLITLKGDSSIEFIGFVSEKSKSFNGGVFTYEVKLIHPVYQLTKLRKTRVFQEGKESKLLESIIDLYPDLGLRFKYKGASVDKVEQLIQYECTDWDFLLSRAEANGCVVAVDGSEIRLVNTSELLKGEASKLIDNSEIKSVNLKSYYQQAVDEVSVSFHNRDNLQAPLAESVKTKDVNLKITQQPAIEETTMCKYQGVFGEVNEAKNWSTGKVLRNLLARIQGKIEVVNLHYSKLLAPVSLAGYEDMNGDSFITGTEIKFQSEKIETVLTIGLSETEFMDLHSVHSPPAGNLLPAIQGLQIGYVAKVEQDSKLKDRIKVMIPSLHAGKEKANKSVWARLIFMAAGHSRGVFFTPEVGDELLVGFLNNDPRHPYVLGCLYSHKTKGENTKQPFLINSKENQHSGIVTKEGLALEFNDSKEGKSLSLYAPGADEAASKDNSFGLHIKRIDQDTVELLNGANNSIVLNKAGIEMKAGNTTLLLNNEGVTVS